MLGHAAEQQRLDDMRAMLADNDEVGTVFLFRGDDLLGWFAGDYPRRVVGSAPARLAARIAGSEDDEKSTATRTVR